MQEIDASAKKIEEIISVIDGIAFQTNLLAQRTAEAAREIKALIADSVEKVSFGGLLVQEASETMIEVVSSIHQVEDIMREISMATKEQVQGIEQVNQAVSEMDTVSQQNAALVEEAAAAAESLQEQAKALVHAMSTFKTEADFTNVLSEKTASSSHTASSKRSKKLSIRLPGYIKDEENMIPARNVSAETYEEKIEEF